MKPYIDIADTRSQRCEWLTGSECTYTKNAFQIARNLERIFCKSLIISTIGGPGGGRTLVQTRKPQAFYMLITD